MTDCKVGDVVRRPWGRYEILAVGPWYKVKRLLIDPGKATSRQYHRNRTEYVFHDSHGRLDVEVVIRGDWHQLRNDTDTVRELIEVQIGDCREADIVRATEAMAS